MRSYTFGNNLSFKEWQASGEDQDSQLANPLFVNVSVYNFALQSTSPALTLGFEQIGIYSTPPVDFTHFFLLFSPYPTNRSA
jgi:hypothetical protein